MAEKLLVVALDRDWVRAGWKLLEQCDREAFPVTDAFWLFVDESEEWSLYMATPLIATQGPLPAISRLRAALYNIEESERAGLALRELSPVEPTFPLVTEMRRRYGTVTAARGQSVRRTHILPGEPFIYRLNFFGTPVLSNGQQPTVKETVATHG